MSKVRTDPCTPHTISDVDLIGGGMIPAPGEISVAHNGVLFMDKLPEFRRQTLEVLRQPLEDSRVTISRAAGSMMFPADFMLVAAMNPCKCGYFGDPKRECRCSPLDVQRYRDRISGPLLDRIDIHVEVRDGSAGPFRANDRACGLIERISLHGSTRLQKNALFATLFHSSNTSHCRDHAPTFSMNLSKQIVLILIATLAFTMPGRCASPESDVKQVVETFYKQYYRDFLEKNEKGGSDSHWIKWVSTSPATSPRFKKAVTKAITDARKKDAELGLEIDPIIAGQDYPKKGYRVRSVKITNDRAAVAMEGIDGKDFHISLELVNSGGHWLIDRIGDIPPGK